MASPRTPLHLTRADLDDVPDDGHRYELVAGELLVSPLARRRHQAVVMEVAVALRRWADAHGGIVYPGVNVDLDAATHLEPDVAWSADTDVSGEGFVRVPELVVEVSSPSTRVFDAGVKRDRYLDGGAVEVWLVDLAADEVHRHVGRGEGDVVVHAVGDVVTSELLPGFAVEVADLLVGRGD